MNEVTKLLTNFKGYLMQKGYKTAPRQAEEVKHFLQWITAETTTSYLYVHYNDLLNLSLIHI